MAEDQNWTSQRAQGFWRDVDAARGEPPENRWCFLSEDDSSSTSDESDDAECEMPAAFVSGSASKGFAPYPSKTVGPYLLINEEEELTLDNTDVHP